MQSDSQKLNFGNIWANVEDMIIKHAYPDMKPDGKYQQLKGKDALTENDLDIAYQNYKGEIVSIRKVYLS